MIFPILTDRDEWNYLETLEQRDLVGYPHTAEQGYYARVLMYKYPQCSRVILTATTFQLFQSGISLMRIDLSLAQRARQELFDALDRDFQGNVLKKDWMEILADEDLLPEKEEDLL